MRTDRTSYAELSEVVLKLLSLDQELDKMLSEYQTSERRSEIDHLRKCCGPMTLLQPIISSLLLEGEEIEVQKDLKAFIHHTFNYWEQMRIDVIYGNFGLIQLRQTQTDGLAQKRHFLNAEKKGEHF